jgi:hypothetical protein
VHVRLLVSLLTLTVVAVFAAAASNMATGAAAQADAPPPTDGYFSLVPAGQSSSLPSGATCAGLVHHSTWEPRPDNTRRNHVVANPQAVHAALAARHYSGGGFDPHWDSWLLPRVDGQFTGTTDEIFQWAACKWGLADNLIRAAAYAESTWYQYLVYPNYHNRCVSYYGCGDFFDHSNADSLVYMNGLARLGGYDYQQDYGAGLGPQTFSILGVMSWQAPSWGQMPDNQNGTFPFNRNSTAFAADYYGSHIRGCFEGWITYLGNGYAPGDLWGCVGNWYSGGWYDSGAQAYIAETQGYLNNHIWLQPGFPNDRPGCHPTYGCPGPDTLPLEPPPPAPPLPPPPPPPPPPPGPPPAARACRVPRVVGRRLASARARLRAAHCSVGRVRKVRSRRALRGHVLKQSPHAGKTMRRGYPVRLVVGRR